ESNGDISWKAEVGASTEYLDHTIDEIGEVIGDATVFLTIAFVVHRRRHRRFKHERPSDTRDVPRRLRTIYQYFLDRWLVVRNRLERDMRNDSSNLLTSRILLPLVHEAAGGATSLIVELVPRICRGEQALTSE